MRKLRLALIFVAAVMMLITTTSCDTKPTEPTVSAGKMILVPGGTFTMGDTRQMEDEGFHYDELPTHSVTVNPFFIGKYMVTQSEYSKYMPSSEMWVAKLGLGKNYPAYGVSWYAAIEYCNLRSLAEGLNPCYTILGSTNPADWGKVPFWEDSTWDAAICDFGANGYRLPTEAEWEYAARAATNNPDYLYSGSEDINAVAWYFDLDDAGWGSRPVGQKSPNSIGTYDMSGNINEWCWDWYDRSYYESSPQDNPTGPDSGQDRVLRGGNWFGETQVCRVASRISDSPHNKVALNGFRLCRSKID